ncbi:WD40-repeat-containing domain protein [Cladochytrium replicatum]|nr:WD40-repeat-containing domain protein [Cladochytrium replicatum]
MLLFEPLSWTFGFNCDLPNSVVNLSDSYRKVILYGSAHVVVLYDWVNGRQQLLQGHVNPISAISATPCRRWVVTTDRGPSESILIIWDTMKHLGDRPASAGNPSVAAGAIVPGVPGCPPVMGVTALPIKTMFDPHQGAGVAAAEFTSDARYLITIGDEKEQVLAIWDWTTESDGPLLTHRIDGGRQTQVKVNPDDPVEFLTTGPQSVNFFVWNRESNVLEQHSPTLSPKDFSHAPTAFTTSTFVPGAAQALSGTAEGDVVLWGDRSLNNLSIKLQNGEKAAVKFVSSAINVLTTCSRKYIVTGGEDGFVKVFDLQLRLLLWLERLRSGPVVSVTFNTPQNIRPTSATKKPAGGAPQVAPKIQPSEDGKRGKHSVPAEYQLEDVAALPDLVVGTSHAKVVLIARSATSSSNIAVPSSDGKTSSAGGGTSIERRASSASAPAVVPDDTSHSFLNPIVKTILETQSLSVNALAAHPRLSRFAVSGASGVIQLWDYTTKALLASRRFDESATNAEKTGADGGGAAVSSKKAKKHGKKECNGVTALCFSGDGMLLGSGFLNGAIRILNAGTLSEIYSHTPSANASTRLVFSDDAMYLASADVSHAVAVFRRASIYAAPKAPGQRRESAREIGSTQNDSWEYLGRRVEHFKDIVGLLFLVLDESSDGSSVETQFKLPPIQQTDVKGKDEDQDVGDESEWTPTKTRLISLSLDRHIVEYALAPSSVSKGLRLKSKTRIEQTARPMAVVPHPLTKREKGELGNSSNGGMLLLVNDEFKFRVLSKDTFFCRKTLLAPTYGGTITKMQAVKGDKADKYLVYSTEEKVAGIISLPLDGNPRRSMGLIAHPGKISNLCVTYDNQYVLSAGGIDGAVHMWGLNNNALDAQLSLGAGPQDSIEPFLHMLDGSGLGVEGPLYKEMEDYFYYAQLRRKVCQGENAMDTRQITDRVDIDQVPLIMQAVGFYPTEQQIEDMINEVKYRDVERTGELLHSVTFDELIRLYINHRPVADLSQSDLEVALAHAKQLEPGHLDPVETIGKLNLDSMLNREGLLALLQQYGETFSASDFNKAFYQLLEDSPPYLGDLPEHFTVKEFIEEILGLTPTVKSLPVQGGQAGGDRGQQSGSNQSDTTTWTGEMKSREGSSWSSGGVSERSDRSGGAVGSGGVPSRVSSAGA